VLEVHVLYMVVSGLAFAGLDLVRKLLAGRAAPLALVFYMSLGAAPVVGALLALRGAGHPSIGYVLPGTAALLLNFLGSLGFIYSVKLSPLSRTIPLLSLTPVFTAAVALPVLGEAPSEAQLLGIVLVVVGAMTLNSEGHVLRPFAGLLREPGALLMAGVAVLWSISGPLDKRALQHASVYFHATVMTLGVSAGALLVLWRQRRLGVLAVARSEWTLLTAAMLAVSVALTFQLLAFQGLLVSLVEAMKRAIGSIAALMLGHIVFEEKVTAVQIAAVITMTAGVFLLLGVTSPW
jgi:drug/metabolite transporter (DMT)-like permease